MVRLFIMMMGFGAAVVGGVSLLAYLNIMTVGYSFLAYLQFISHRPELYIFIVGSLMVIGSIVWPEKRRNQNN
ncbi:hypothetical protein [Bacillus sp. FJAT-45037]|uniref:hypothetical protein n=1 Tax=Bacillus sp. FJAT-45037 TaxID=2011007 RepID=UPI000C23FC23|nr:hypothetical protein [Bacillus sp. FJAT-45037]